MAPAFVLVLERRASIRPHKGRSNLLNLRIGPKIDSDFRADALDVLGRAADQLVRLASWVLRPFFRLGTATI